MKNIHTSFNKASFFDLSFFAVFVNETVVRHSSARAHTASLLKTFLETYSPTLALFDFGMTALQGAAEKAECFTLRSVSLKQQ